MYKFRFTLVFVLVILTSFLFSDDWEDSSSFAFENGNSISDNLQKNINSSVNLSTGDLNLPVQLISLPGNINLTASYSSNVNLQVINKNLESPTGIMGLGWNIGFDKIVVDHKQTASNLDDEYYLITSGKMTELIFVESQNGICEFVLKDNNIIKIYFDESQNKWTFYDGSQKETIFGLNSDALQWTIGWKHPDHPANTANYIGSSSSSANQERIVTAWFLSTITDNWGNSISYSYENETECVGDGSLEYTKASYLKTISNNLEYLVTLNYEVKEDFEYQDPHVEMTEDPTTGIYDAYQECFEDRYLKEIVVERNNDELHSVYFDYTSDGVQTSFIGSGEFSKRILRSIKKYNKNDDLIEDTQFNYYENDLGNVKHKGFLSEIITNNGAITSYTYTEKTIYTSLRNLSGAVGLSPVGGYDQSKVFVHNDYAVVLWKAPLWDYIYVFAYRWDGRWIASDLLATITGVNDFNNSNEPDDFGIVLEDDFFAILNYYHEDSSSRTVHFFRWEPNINNWDHRGKTLTSSSSSENNMKIVSGDNFVAIIGRERGKIYRYALKNKYWVESILDTDNYVSTGDEDDFEIVGDNNYFLFHRKQGDPDLLEIHYLDKALEWQIANFDSEILFNTYRDIYSSFNAGSTFLTVRADFDDPEQSLHEPLYIYHWDKNFENIEREFIGNTSDNSLSMTTCSETVSISNAEITWGLRWFGSDDWQKKSNFTRKGRTSSLLSLDLILRRNYEPEGEQSNDDGWVEGFMFNPNISSWERVFEKEYITYPKTFSSNTHFGYYTRHTGEWEGPIVLYNRKTDGWQLNTTISPGTNNRFGSVESGYNYIVYNIESTDNGHEGCRIIIKNSDEQWSDPEVISNSFYTGGFNTVGGNIFVARNTQALSSTTLYRLYRVINDGFENSMINYPVQRIDIYDGYGNSETTSFDYSTSSMATFDRNCNTASYNKVTVYPGGSEDNGKIEHFFITKLPLINHAYNEILNSSYSNCNLYLPLLKGREYLTIYKDSGNNEISRNEYYWNVYPTYQSSTTLSQDCTYNISLNRTETTKSGITNVSDFTYREYSELPEEKRIIAQPVGNITYIKNNSNFYVDEVKTNKKYFYEEYLNANDDECLLSSTILTEKLINNEIVEVSVITYKDWGTDHWAPWKSYIWAGTGSNEFTWWDGSIPTEDWIKTNEIISMDTSNGNIIETSDIDEIHSVVKWGYDNKLPIAQISNSTDEETVTLDFESGDHPGWASMNGGGTVSNYSAYTGSYGIEFDGIDSHAICFQSIDEDKLDLSGKYLFSAKVFNKVDASDKSLLRVYLDHEGGVTTIDEYSTSFGKWEIIECIIDFSLYVNETFIMFFVQNGIDDGSDFSEVYFDDIRFYPIDATFTSSTYDPVTMQKISETDDTGNSIFYEYDDQYRMKLTYGDENKLLSGIGIYNSVDGSSTGTFDPLKPNAAYSITSQTGYFNDFNHSSLDEINWIPESGIWDLNNGKLIQTDTNNENTRCVYEIEQTNYMVYEWDVEITDDNGVSGLYIMASDGNDSYMGNSYLIQTCNTGLLLFQSTNNNLTYLNGINLSGNKSGHWTVMYFNGIIDVYIDWQQVAIWDLNVIGYPGDPLQEGGYVSFNTNNTAVEFDNITIYKDASVSAVFSDGLGRTIQTQSLDDTGVIVSQQIYDDLGRSAIQTKPGRYDNETFGYKPGFASYDWGEFTISGNVLTMNLDDNGYPYSRVKFENSPLSRKTEAGLPGSDYAIIYEDELNSYLNNTVKYEYNLDPSIYDQQQYDPSHYQAQKVIDPIGVEAVQISDQLGRTVMEISDPGGLNIRTEYIYDEKGNLVEKHVPNYFDLPDGSVEDDWVEEITYDHFSRITERSATDIGTLKSLYSRTGKLRFTQDEEGSTIGYFSYIKYDNLNRVVETGYFNGLLSGAGNYVDDLNWPLETTYTWRKKYVYDDDGFYSGLRGQLFGVITNNDDDIQCETEEYYIYNKYGDIIQNKAYVSDYIQSNIYIFDYEYNEAGNVTIITYPSLDVPEQMVIEYENISNPEYAAISSITAGSDNNLVNVTDDNPVVFKAGEEIILLPGFCTDTGADFTAKIDDVQPSQPQKVVTYTYNNRGKLISIGTPNDEDFYANYVYNIDGSMQTETINNSNTPISVTNSYNSPGSLDEISVTNDLFSENLSYEYNGNISQLDFNDYSYLFTYDSVGRLHTADNTTNIEFDYFIPYNGYDANGNFKTLLRGTLLQLDYSYYPGTNKVFSVNSSIYNYDNNGNIIDSPKADNIEYDKHSRMTTNMTKDNSAMNLVYDNNNVRVLKDVDDHKTLYLHGLSDYPLVEEETGGLQRFYFYGPTGLIAMEDIGGTYYVLKDHLGSTRVVINEVGEEVESFDFDAFGNLMNSSVSTDVAYQYTGQEYDDEVDLHNFRARFYDSDLMRFYAVDPAGQTASPYLFCGNNPIMYVDENGEFAFLIPMLMGAGMGAIQADIQGEDLWKGALVGAVAGATGGTIGGQSFFMSQTAGIIASSSVSSLGFELINPEKNEFTVAFGVGSYNFEKKEWGYFGKKGNNIMQNYGYGFGALANLQDLKTGFDGFTYQLNSAQTKGNHGKWGHISLTDPNNPDPTSGVNVGPLVPVGAKTLDELMTNRAGKAWDNNYANTKGTFKLKIPNISKKIYQNYISEIAKGNVQWNVFPGNSCASHVGRMLWRNWIPNVAIHPHFLFAQMYLRQLGIYSSPFLIREWE